MNVKIRFPHERVTQPVRTLTAVPRRCYRLYIGMLRHALQPYRAKDPSKGQLRYVILKD